MTQVPIIGTQKVKQEDGFVLVHRSQLKADTTEPLVFPSAVREEKGESKEVKVASRAMRAALAGMSRGGHGMYYRTIIGAQSPIAYGASTKYLCDGFATGTNGVGAIVGGASEFTSLTSLFQDAFIHSVDFTFEPSNMNSSNSAASALAAGSPGYLNTCGLVAASTQHGFADYTDSVASIAEMLTNEEHRVLNSASRWTYQWKNIDKFYQNSPADTSGNSQTWMRSTLVSANYGGTVQFIQARVSVTSAGGIANPPGNGIFGHLFVRADVSFRYRD